MRLRDLSIQRKLMLIIMLTTVLAVVLASVAYLVYDSRTFQRKIENDLETLASMLQANTVSYLLFNDRETVESILADLPAQDRERPRDPGEHAPGQHRELPALQRP